MKPNKTLPFLLPQVDQWLQQVIQSTPQTTAIDIDPEHGALVMIDTDVVETIRQELADYIMLNGPLHKYGHGIIPGCMLIVQDETDKKITHMIAIFPGLKLTFNPPAQPEPEQPATPVTA